MLLLERSYVVMLTAALRKIPQNIANGRNTKVNATASEYIYKKSWDTNAARLQKHKI